MDFTIQQHYEVDSTQKLALKLAKKESKPHGIVVLAEKQTKGIGRKGRKWESPLGGLYMSIIVKKPIPVKFFQGFSVKFGLEIAKSLEAKTQLPLKVKWPNDLMVNGKKIGGILMDISTQHENLDYLVTGIGFNVNVQMKSLPDDVQKIATSLLEELSKRYPIKIVKDEILNAMNNLIKEFELGYERDIKEEWRKRSFTFGQTITTEALGEKVSGIESGISENGNLLIRVNDELKEISAGDVYLS